jgi:hypothetical protein
MSVDPYQTPTARVADPADGYLEVTWGRATRVWWSFMWRTVVFAALAGGVLGFVAGGILGAAGAPNPVIAGIVTWLGLGIGIPIGIWVTRIVLGKAWGDFRIALVPNDRR